MDKDGRGNWVFPGESQGLLPVEEIMARLLPGDVVFESSSTLLSRLISWVSRDAAVKNWVPSHVEIVTGYSVPRGAITFSAEARGYIPRALRRLFDLHSRVEIWRPLGLEEIERKRLKRQAFFLSVDDEGYGVAEFLSFGLTFIKPKAGNRQNICSEAVVRVFNAAGLPLFGNQDPEKLRPSDIYKRVVLNQDTGLKFGLVAVI
jgi:hypothetical protein